MVDVSFNEMKVYMAKKRDEVIDPIIVFVSQFSYTDNEQKIIVEYLSIDQLIVDIQVKNQLMFEIKIRCVDTFYSILDVMNNEYKQHLIKQKVLNDYSYLNFREKFPLKIVY